ncbi:MAG TPA: type II 3-dehydroquinate dehydratase [Candidatus Krumholzibacteria bacterium]|nr:type II 3-dehydroquinate dehydratase [Candidatus Krumholzibacteria bacterium]
MKILVIHGPNLNLLGTREPEIYGTQTLAQIDAGLARHGRDIGVEVESFQSNHEGEIIDRIQRAVDAGVAAIVLNPGAYTHTSLAIADAIRAIATPVVEVHLSNLHARGAERARSVTASACRGIVSGFGADSYRLGIDAALRLARAPKRARKTAASASRARSKASKTRRTRSRK